MRSFARIMVGERPPSDPLSPADFRRVLLTGATGFIGRFALRDLLEANSRLVVHCLVRCDSPERGAQRVRAALLDAGIWDDAFADRIVILPGDICETWFGLNRADFSDLCERVDAVYHFAADISLASSYLAIRKVNASSIRNILELCISVRYKHLFYASTMGIFPEYFCDFSKEFKAASIGYQMQPDLANMKRIFPTGIIGYPWTKLVAEQAILSARALGMPAAIFRLPRTNFSSLGFSQANDFGVRVFSAVVDTRMAPPGVSFQSYSEPVDTLSRICIDISVNPGRKSTIYHCCNPEPVYRNLELSEFGLYVREVSYASFKSACQARGKRSPLYGHWTLVDHVAQYWFTADKGKSSWRVCDRAIREDCPRPIPWPGMLTMFRRSFDWVRSHADRWPHPVPLGCLDIDHLIEQGERYAERARTSVERAYPEWMRQRLRRLVEALNAPETGLLESDRNFTVFDLSRLLRNNAMLARERQEHPEIEREEIERPIFIVGINRTGTTFLHRLLARDERFSTLRAYELFEPVMQNDEDDMTPGGATDPRRAMLADLLDASDAIGNLAGIHPVDIDEPEEDFPLMRLGFSCWTNPVRYRLPGYRHWLATADSKQVYHHHGAIMQHFAWWRRRRQPGRPKQWLFKMPFHLMALDALLETYPDALFIQTHREPASVMGSWNSLVERVRSAAIEPRPRDETGAEELAFMSGMLNGATKFRLASPELEHRWADVAYADLVRDPMAVVGGIYDRFGWPLGRTAESRMGDWLSRQAEQRRHETRHSYRMEDFGLTPEAVNAAFAPYLEFLAARK